MAINDEQNQHQKIIQQGLPNTDNLDTIWIMILVQIKKNSASKNQKKTKTKTKQKKNKKNLI